MHSFARSHSVVLASMALAALLVVATSATGKSDSYTVSLLSNPDGIPYIYANDINDSGRIVGGQEFFVEGTGWVQEAVLWKKWTADPVILTPLKGHTNALALAINNPGQVCGYSTNWAGSMKAVIWGKDGKAVDMHPDLSNSFSQMWDVNQYGDAVGITYVPSYARAFVTFDGEDPELLELDTDVYVQSWPYEINKDGVIVGFARIDDGSGWGPIHACYWDEDGEFEDLNDDMADDLGISVFSSRAWAISDDGAIGGVAVISLDANYQPEDLRAFVWTADDGFSWVDNGGSDLSAIGGGAGKYFVGLIDGALQGYAWYTATATIWERKVAKGEVYWDLELLPMPKGHLGMATWGATTSGRVVGVSVGEDGYWYAWYADK